MLNSTFDSQQYHLKFYALKANAVNQVLTSLFNNKFVIIIRQSLNFIQFTFTFKPKICFSFVNFINKFVHKQSMQNIFSKADPRIESIKKQREREKSLSQKELIPISYFDKAQHLQSPQSDAQKSIPCRKKILKMQDKQNQHNGDKKCIIATKQNKQSFHRNSKQRKTVKEKPLSNAKKCKKPKIQKSTIQKSQSQTFMQSKSQEYEQSKHKKYEQRKDQAHFLQEVSLRNSTAALLKNRDDCDKNIKTPINKYKENTIKSEVYENHSSTNQSAHKQLASFNNSQFCSQTKINAILSTHQIVPLQYAEYVKKLEEKNLLYELKIQKLLKELIQKQKLLDLCGKQIYHLKKTYDLMFKMQEMGNFKKNKNQPSNDEKQKELKQNCNASTQLSAKIPNQQKSSAIPSSQIEHYSRIQYTDPSICLDQSSYIIQKPCVLVVQQSSFQISNSNVNEENFSNPNIKLIPLFREQDQHQNQFSKIKSDSILSQCDLMVKAKCQIESARRDIQALRNRINSVNFNSDALNQKSYPNKYAQNSKQKYQSAHTQQNMTETCKRLPLQQKKIVNNFPQSQSFVIPVHRLSKNYSKNRI